MAAGVHGARGLEGSVTNPSKARFVVGIDLGTTNTTVSWGEVTGGSIESLPIEQLVGEGEVAPRSVLPSALYLAGAHEVAAGTLALPWSKDRRLAVGSFARTLGTRVPGRLIVSAKSWLCHGGVDREAGILPWGGPDEVDRISPVESSRLILEHLREAWDHLHPEALLADQDVVLTVPASFDEVARELTVRAAEEAGISRLRLLEEPQAAIYSWLASQPDWQAAVGGHQRILVVDVGGGTTDFSTLAVRRSEAGLTLERTAVGDHILLGGDNMDLALAGRILERAGGRPVDALRWQQLAGLCRDAKERLLGEGAPDRIPISIGGRGRGIIADAIRADLVPEDVLAEVLDGFFPAVQAGDRPRETTGAGLVEFGLPYAADPAVTRHLAAFLGRDGSAIPDAVLFNGGAVGPTAVRTRLLDVLESWSGRRPVELGGGDLHLAVSRGAVAYGFARRGHGVRIAGGSARAYYLGVAEDRGTDRREVVCVAPRGMEEGDRVEVEGRDFLVRANEPVRFTIYASSTRTGDLPAGVVEVEAGSVTELPDLTTMLRFGKRLEAREVPVRLQTHLTETGTLEIYCTSTATDHRWRLSFDLRARSVVEGASRGNASGASPEDGQELVLPEASVASACDRVASCFGGDLDPVPLVRDLEAILEAGKDAWPLASIRQLLDVALENESGRARSPAHEARWLNLVGFLFRPGWGEERDAWRAEKLWRLFEPGLCFANAIQGRAEWWTMWKRAAGGLSRTQQKVLHQEIRPVLLPTARKKGKPSRWKAGKQELREMWQVAGNLERIEAGARQELGTALVPKVRRGKASESEIWALGRLAARAPVYGPANTVVSAKTVGRWLEELLDASWEREAAIALAVAQMARRTGDPARDIPPEVAERVAARLGDGPRGAELARWVLEVVQMDVAQQAMVLADGLPTGLRIVADADAPAS